MSNWKSIKEIKAAWGDKAKALCVCGHTGDGTASGHGGPSYQPGHGACFMPHCSCMKFTFKEFLPEFLKVARE